MKENKGTVCVTGGTGYIASWLIMRLLENGYSVNTTIRPHPERKRDMSFLKNLPGAPENLHIFEAELSNPESFDEAIQGCIGVFHLAASIDLGKGESVEVLTRRSINAVLEILKSCLKSKTVKRVVYTSSQSAVIANGKNVEVMDESFWSSVDNRQAKQAYTISKTLTEKAALEFAEEHGLELVTVILPFVVGPFICPQFPISVRMILAMVLGDNNYYPMIYNSSMVHIDDVVRAHIFLFEHPDAKGRYICSSEKLTLLDMAKLLSAKYPEFPIPSIEYLKEIKGYKMPGLSSKKLLESGFEFKYGVDEMFDGAIECCKEKGYL
ncbi:hypothetical protein HS088_TW12G00781 [Tripterygium wilfordii]|uniref:NAD-dependent epimerase/dehydratase domain-containing protein n=2 Tax=Tripterygium wilfordii TaxID=458696 RepID=A0A7J7CZN7_TRIWF|nr:hypothetical protein HS088_TW12G00781 [Tripterygium wilfordii]